ncbi:MAG: hypothetical protein WDN26_19990 [Chitinophagaceae bacterium]
MAKNKPLIDTSHILYYPDIYRERRPDKHRGLRQMLSKEQEDERSVATKMIVVMEPGKCTASCG